MGFRTIDVCNQAEIHIRNKQLLVTTKEGTVSVPIEDLSIVSLHGANIRLSSMDLSLLTREKVSVMTLDDHYLPTAIVLPFHGHSRQSKMMHAQVSASQETIDELWISIIKAKISNQSRALSILGLQGTEKVAKCSEELQADNVDFLEAQAAQVYFANYHKGLNRRTEDPVNSRLNYGYAVVRSAIARSLVASGFHPTFGIHHNSQLNAFNLADDLIEPYRAIVDLVVHENIDAHVQLSKQERKKLASVLHLACKMDDTVVNVLKAIDMMVESLKRIILDASSERLLLPIVIPPKDLGRITE